MNPTAIEAENFHRYHDLALTLPTGCTAIVGPNGAGKSTLLEAIDVALYGGLHDHITPGETATSVTLTFEHRSDLYRVRRGWKRGKPTLDLEVYRPLSDDWEPLTRENVKATQAYLEDLLGIARATLLASSVSKQQDGAAFTAAKPAQRKQLLCDALGLDIWARLQQRAREELRTVERDLAVAQAAATRLEEEVAGRPQLEQQIDTALAATADEQALLDKAENDLALVSERYQEARDQAARREALEIQLRAALDDLKRLTDLDLAASTAETQIAVTREQLVGLPQAGQTDRLEQRLTALEARIAQHRDQLHAHEHATGLAEQRQRERARLLERATGTDQFVQTLEAKIRDLQDHDDALCQTCGQTLPDDAKQRAIASYTDELARHQAAAQADRVEADQVEIPAIPAAPEGDPPTVELETVRRQLKATQDATSERGRLEERIVQLQRDAAARPAPQLLTDAGRIVAERTADLDQLEPVTLAAIEAEGRATKNAVEARRRRVAELREGLASLRTWLEQIVSRESQLAGALATVAVAQKRIDLLKRAEKAYGPAGIPALILENAAIPQIETEANRIIGALGWPYRVRLDTQRELKSSDGVRDSLDIVVETSLGEQTWEQCSGGEQQRINLALRLAIAELIATRRAVEVKLLAVDEPDGLDADGFQAFVDLLHDLEHRGVFEKILVVSHHPELKHAFEQVIEVHGGGKTDTPSRLVGQLEAVAA